MLADMTFNGSQQYFLASPLGLYKKNFFLYEYVQFNRQKNIQIKIHTEYSKALLTGRSILSSSKNKFFYWVLKTTTKQPFDQIENNFVELGFFVEDFCPSQ